MSSPVALTPFESAREGRFCLTRFSEGSYNRAERLRGGLRQVADFTHFNESGRARMVDVSAKGSTERIAVAQGRVMMLPETLRRIQEGKIAKGDVLAVAQVAGVMGAKRTPDLVPMCHPLMLTSVNIDFRENPTPDERGQCSLTIQAAVKTNGQTGVEMEAMTAVAVAALTIYDMCKAVDKGMSFGDVCLVSKSGGKSGTYQRADVEVLAPAHGSSS